MISFFTGHAARNETFGRTSSSPNAIRIPAVQWNNMPSGVNFPHAGLLSGRNPSKRFKNDPARPGSQILGMLIV